MSCSTRVYGYRLRDAKENRHPIPVVSAEYSSSFILQSSTLLENRRNNKKARLLTEGKVEVICSFILHYFLASTSTVKYLPWKGRWCIFKEIHPDVRWFRLSIYITVHISCWAA